MGINTLKNLVISNNLSGIVFCDMRKDLHGREHRRLVNFTCRICYSKVKVHLNCKEDSQKGFNYYLACQSCSKFFHNMAEDVINCNLLGTPTRRV